MHGRLNFSFWTWAALILILWVETSTAQRSDLNFDPQSAIDHAASKLEATLREIDYTSSLHPSHTDPETGEWDIESMRREEWTSGFFSGSLWYMYQVTGDEKWRNLAEDWTRDLEPMSLGANDHDTGFRIFTSYGTGFSLTGNLSYSRTILRGAQTLATRFNPDIGAIKSWDWIGNFPVIIDNLMNLEILFWAASETGNSTLYDIAKTHAETSLKHHLREDGSNYHIVDFNDTGNVIWKNTLQGYGPESVWARGQSWAIYGFTMIYRYTGEQKFLDAAEKASLWFINNLPDDSIPIYDFLEPVPSVQTKDASAAAIAASGFLELFKITGNTIYFNAAERILYSLSTEEYSTQSDRENSILKRSTLHRGKGRLGTSYADYYYLEAIVRYLEIENEALPDIDKKFSFFLDQNFPNPFTTTTTLYYSVPESALVKLEVFNTLGQKVQTVVHERKEAGNYNATLRFGSLPAGVYFYSLTANGEQKVKKMTLVR
jgi:rhamnogalacturonyl hydrolase YesR